jgi:hypothetical protein
MSLQAYDVTMEHFISLKKCDRDKHLPYLPQRQLTKKMTL